MFLSLLHVNVGNDPNHPGRRWLSNIYRVHQRLWMAFPDEHPDKHRHDQDKFFLGAWNGPPIAEPKPQRCKAGFLFRIERDGRPRILVQSAQRPKWEYAFQNAPYLLVNDPARQPEVREFVPAPIAGQHYRFRLLANVVTRKSVVHPNGKKRKNRGDLTIKQRVDVPVLPGSIPDPLPGDPVDRDRALCARWDSWRKWLGEMGGKCGFSVVDNKGSPLLVEAVHTSVRNPGKGRGGSNQPLDQRFNAGLFDGVLVCVNPDQLRDALIAGVGKAKAFGFGLLSVRSV